MNRIDRLFGILLLLQSRKYVTAETIAEKFGISVRTVYRDIKALSEQGVPVSFEQPRGYFIVQGYFLPPVMFSTDEANALLLMEKMVQGFGDRSIREHYSAALLKVKNVLRPAEKERLEAMGNSIGMQVHTAMQIGSDHLSQLQQAIAAKMIVRIDYRNNESAPSNREIEPVGLVFYALHWHLIAWCHKRREYRDFRVSRIVKAVQTDIPFTITEHVPMSEHMKNLPVDY